MTVSEEEKLAHIRDSIGKANAAFQTINSLIRGILETGDAPLINHFLVKLNFAVNGLCKAYFEGFDPVAKAMIEEHVKSTLPESIRTEL